MVYVPFKMASSFDTEFYSFNFVPMNLSPMLETKNSGENFSHDLGLKPDSPCVHAAEEKRGPNIAQTDG